MSKTALSVVLMVVLATSAIIYAGSNIVYGVRSFVTDPAITHKLAIETAGDGWQVSHFDNFSTTYHRYIVKKDGARRDVNVTRDDNGNWQARLTPTF